MRIVAKEGLESIKEPYMDKPARFAKTGAGTAQVDEEIGERLIEQHPGDIWEYDPDADESSTDGADESGE